MDHATATSTPSRLRRLKQRADFERALGGGPQAVVARSPHFVLHHVGEAPQAEKLLAADQLSTGFGAVPAKAVDVLAVQQGAVRAGAVLPKRWARRSVTRSLLKRQVFAAIERQLTHMPAGVWVVRLRSAFDREQFPSASSDALRLAARAELDLLMSRAVQRRVSTAAPGSR